MTGFVIGDPARVCHRVAPQSSSASRFTAFGSPRCLGAYGVIVNVGDWGWLIGGVALTPFTLAVEPAHCSILPAGTYLLPGLSRIIIVIPRFFSVVAIHSARVFSVALRSRAAE
jgi:hypothetical protein